MKLRSLGKQKEKIQKMASVLSDHIFTKTVDFQIFRSFLESLFEPPLPLIETFSSYNKKLSWPNPLSCSVMRPKKALNNHSPKMVSSRYFDSTSTTTVTTEKNALSLSSWKTAALKRARWPRLKEQATQFDEHHISRNPLN